MVIIFRKYGFINLGAQSHSARPRGEKVRVVAGEGLGLEESVDEGRRIEGGQVIRALS